MGEAFVRIHQDGGYITFRIQRWNPRKRRMLVPVSVPCFCFDTKN